MSRSNNTDLVNPAVHFIEWKGGEGNLRYYDKTKEENVTIPIPFKFLVLDCLSTIKGYSKSDESGFWSNEIRNIKEDKLIVRTKKGKCAEGFYSSVSAAPECKGYKYTQSVYIAMRENGKLILVNLQFYGCAVSAWIEFRKKNKNIYKGAIEIAERIEGKNGNTVFFSPVFKMIETLPETDLQAREIDKELQTYLTAYFGKAKEHSDIPDGFPQDNEFDSFPDEIPPDPTDELIPDKNGDIF
jgi:hypothetical protein